jgi:hypothetical protein
MNSGLYLIGNEVILYDKKELIQKFIKENMPKMINGQSVQTAFAQCWDAEKEQAYDPSQNNGQYFPLKIT